MHERLTAVMLAGQERSSHITSVISITVPHQYRQGPRSLSTQLCLELARVLGGPIHENDEPSAPRPLRLHIAQDDQGYSSVADERELGKPSTVTGLNSRRSVNNGRCRP